MNPLKTYWVEVKGFDSHSSSGTSAGVVRMRAAKQLEELGYFKTIGEALKAIRVTRGGK